MYLLDVLAQTPSSIAIQTLLSKVSDEPIDLIQKDFKTVSYRSSQSHGVSLQFEQDDSKSKWICKAIDIYNKDAVKGWSCFPRLPVHVTLLDQDGSTFVLNLTADTTGIDLVKELGEPSRKGGGEPMKGGGASGLGPGAWMEWNLKYNDRQIQVMIEMAGQEARGKDRWEKERAGIAKWGICTFAIEE
jgi:hypothetical protein